jgi:hypothetical protein
VCGDFLTYIALFIESVFEVPVKKKKNKKRRSVEKKKKEKKKSKGLIVFPFYSGDAL